MFWNLLKLLGDNIHQLNYKDNFLRTPIADTVYNRHSHYFFALLNYGFKIKNADYDNSNILDLDSKYKSTTLVTFIKSNKLQQVIKSTYKNGLKLLSIMNKSIIRPRYYGGWSYIRI